MFLFLFLLLLLKHLELSESIYLKGKRTTNDNKTWHIFLNLKLKSSVLATISKQQTGQPLTEETKLTEESWLTNPSANQKLNRRSLDTDKLSNPTFELDRRKTFKGVTENQMRTTLGRNTRFSRKFSRKKRSVLYKAKTTDELAAESTKDSLTKAGSEASSDFYEKKPADEPKRSRAMTLHRGAKLFPVKSEVTTEPITAEKRSLLKVKKKLEKYRKKNRGKFDAQFFASKNKFINKEKEKRFRRGLGDVYNLGLIKILFNNNIEPLKEKKDDKNKEEKKISSKSELIIYIFIENQERFDNLVKIKELSEYFVLDEKSDKKESDFVPSQKLFYIIRLTYQLKTTEDNGVVTINLSEKAYNIIFNFDFHGKVEKRTFHTQCEFSFNLKDKSQNTEEKKWITLEEDDEQNILRANLFQEYLMLCL